MEIYYFLFLFISFIAIGYLTFKSYKETKDYIIPITTFFFIYFTLGAAILFPIDYLSNFELVNIGLHYHPIFERLFIVHFDETYFLSIGLLVLFIVSFLVFILVGLKMLNKKMKANETLFNSINYEVKGKVVLLFTILMVAISVFCLWGEILDSIEQCKSVYLTTRGNKNRLYTLHQLANEFSVLIPFLFYSIIINKSNNSKIKISISKQGEILVFLSCVISAAYITFLGNRREILSGIIICTLFFLKNYKTIPYKKFAYLFLVVFVMFLSNDFMRSSVIPKQMHKLFMYGKPVVIKNDDFFTSDEISSKVKAKQVITSFMFSNELFYAHFSMYGVLKHNVKPNYLISFKYLATSIIPRSIYPNRPDDVYTYYVKSVQAKPGQIYTIHHATAWYLNLGYFGIILGAFILALIFLGGYLINWVTFKSKNKFLLLGAELGLILICAQMVTFITAGPEAYKALIIEGFILPILIFSALINTKNEKRIN